MAFFAILMMGDVICRTIGITTPDFIKKIQESKVMYGITGFLVSNMIQSNLMQTGAFEIKVDGKLVFSKLESHRMPNM
jgi:selT/selW/selH-like putative selenoprotein